MTSDRLLARSVHPLASLVLALCLMVPLSSRADTAFSIENASSQLDDTVYFLNAVLKVRLPDYIVSAINQGFDLPLVVEIEVHRQRSMWFDERVIFIRQQYRLSYHTLLDEYSLLDVNSGMRRYFPSLEKAIAAFSVMFQYPAVDRNSLDPKKDYMIRCRVGVDGAGIPLPLKSSSLWQNDWDLRSDWSEWELDP